MKHTEEHAGEYVAIADSLPSVVPKEGDYVTITRKPPDESSQSLSKPKFKFPLPLPNIRSPKGSEAPRKDSSATSGAQKTVTPKTPTSTTTPESEMKKNFTNELIKKQQERRASATPQAQETVFSKAFTSFYQLLLQSRRCHRMLQLR